MSRATNGSRESKTSERRLAATERTLAALELRKSGATYQQIATKLGYKSSAGAYGAVKRALRAVIREPAEDVRELELARLDALLEVAWRKATTGDGSLYAIDRALEIMRRRAALLGLDAPAEVNVSIRDEVERLARDSGLDVDAVMSEALAILGGAG